MILGKQEKRILKWLSENPSWHLTSRVAEELVPEYYTHTPREWVNLKLRRLVSKGLVRDRQIPGGNIKVWKVTEDGVDEIRRRCGNADL
jgi:hypothetical protein